MEASAQPSRPDVELSDFALDIRDGLLRTPKVLPSKYFYDQRGDQLFQQIMQMPEYYLTRCEREIFERQHGDILRAISARPFELIELGAGDGSKTKILLRHFIEEDVPFTYRPVDISGSVLAELEKDLNDRWPSLPVRPLWGDYMRMLEKVNREDKVPKVILFLGSNIGNLEPSKARAFLQRLAANMQAGDYLLLGVDLKKDPSLILAAYNDAQGITEAFNKNILRRINRELEADFDLDAFMHWETYDPVSGAARSHLVSRRRQLVRLGVLGMEVPFAPWEAIRVELSQKYHLSEVEAMAADCQLNVEHHFLDSRAFFVDTLWKKA